MMEEIISFITSPPPFFWFLVVKILFIAFGLFLGGMIIFVLATTSWLRYIIVQDLVEFFTYKPYGVRKMVKGWRKIIQRLETGGESEYKLAILDADRLLDGILKKMGYPGKELVARLDQLTEATLPNLNQVRKAHHIRIEIIRNPDYRLSLDEARKVMGIYEKALTDLRAL